MEENQKQLPEEKSQDQIAEYHADIQQIELEGYELGVKKARNALFWAAGLILLGEVIGYARSGAEIEPIGIAIIAVIVGVFIALAIWTKKKPYTAIVLGIIAFCAYIIFVVAINGYVGGAEAAGKALISGFLVKILIFVALIRPLNDARELQKVKEEKNS